MQRQGKGGAKSRLSCYVEIFWNKKAFRYYIKQIDSMLPCAWFSNRSQKTSKCGKNISDTLRYASCATFLFLPHFDVICDLLLNRRKATWNLFVNYKHGLMLTCRHAHVRPHCLILTEACSSRLEWSISREKYLKIDWSVKNAVA